VKPRATRTDDDPLLRVVRWRWLSRLAIGISAGGALQLNERRSRGTIVIAFGEESLLADGRPRR